MESNMKVHARDSALVLTIDPFSMKMEGVTPKDLAQKQRKPPQRLWVAPDQRASLLWCGTIVQLNGVNAPSKVMSTGRRQWDAHRNVGAPKTDQCTPGMVSALLKENASRLLSHKSVQETWFGMNACLAKLHVILRAENWRFALMDAGQIAHAHQTHQCCWIGT